MNIQKEQELINRYRHLLHPDYVSWKNGLGFMQVSDGWTHIIEGMLESIDRHQKYAEKYLGKPFGMNDKIKFTEPMVVQISTIKEKFSSLRVYVDVNEPYKEWMDGVITMATEMASRTCECCGTVDQSVLGMTDGWIAVICKPCYEKKSETLGEDWKKRNNWLTPEEARKRFHFILL